MLKIRLRRMGAKKAPFYRMPAELKVDNEKAAAWMKNGAQPTDTVRALLKKSGAIE